MKRQPIGVDDFKHIIDNNLFFVDKTLFIKEIIDDSSQVVMITRPSRFGKTLNMSLLRYYFEINDEDTSYMFNQYKIWNQGESYRNEQGKYPVINITFKGVKTNNWETNFDLITLNIKSEFQRHLYLLDSDKLDLSHKRDIEKILMDEARVSDYIKSLELLSKVLYLHHKQKVIILLDEYDTLLNEAYIHGHWQDAINFMQAFMNEGFKNNQYLYKGILTGIFRVAKESIFSDMNNLNVSVKGGSVTEMLKALLIGDIRTFYKIFATTVERSVSYHDVGDDKSESFYHAFVLGLLVNLDTEYDIRSNRESGYGRYDVMIIPKDKNKKGIIMEFKKVDRFENETVETALKAALKQIEDKKYETELIGLGIKDIIKIGIVFNGKEVRVDTV